jgi:hypothetical protein
MRLTWVVGNKAHQVSGSDEMDAGAIELVSHSMTHTHAHLRHGSIRVRRERVREKREERRLRSRRGEDGTVGGQVGGVKELGH